MKSSNLSSFSSKCLVVGGGITGLTTAFLLAKQGYKVELWEKEKQLGGMLSPVSFQGQLWDKGSHRIHPAADPLLLELTKEEEWLQRPRKGRLVLNQKQIAYPLALLDFLQGLGTKTSISMALGFLLNPKNLQRFLSWEQNRGQTFFADEGFEEFVIQRVGKSAYKKFYQPYVEKVWGLDPSQISKTVAKQRISSSKPWENLLASLGKKQSQQAPHFLYPRRGMAGLLERMQQKVEEAGVSVVQKEVTCQKDLPLHDFEAIFYTAPLQILLPEHRLEQKGLYLLHCLVSSDSLQDVDTFYTPEKKYWFGRVSQPHQFSPYLSYRESPHLKMLCIEIPEGKWGTQCDFVAKKKELLSQLQHAKIIGSKGQIADIQQTYLSHIYPMATRDWVKRWSDGFQEIKKLEKVFLVGRQGLFLHCNIDHCVRMAEDVVKHWSQGKSTADWLDSCVQYLDFRVRD